MPQISRNALVMYSDKAIFDLVNDVKHYPRFLPHCSNATIIEATEQQIIASVEIKKGPICKTFTTRNSLSKYNKITMELVDGPFKLLHGCWSFSKLDEHACKVELTLHYEFSSTLIEVAFGKLFKEVASNMVLAFTRRAKDIYG